jgi:hypothetical protein
LFGTCQACTLHVPREIERCLAPFSCSGMHLIPGGRHMECACYFIPGGRLCHDFPNEESNYDFFGT